MRKTMTICCLCMAALCLPTTANAQFGSLMNAARKKAQSVLSKTKDAASRQAATSVSEATGTAGGSATVGTATTRTAAPWPMQSAEPNYNGKSSQEFLYGIMDESDEYLESLRQQMYDRYKANVPLKDNGDYKARTENDNFWRFYYLIRSIVSSNIFNIELSPQGSIISENASYLITSRAGGGIGYMAMKKNDKFVFTTLKGDGAYLDDADLATAKDAAKRMRKLQKLTYALHVMLKEAGEECDKNIRVLYNYCGIYANAVEKAAEANTPENIERKPRPATGAMHASLRAKALQVAKADDSSVTDVIITSAAWDVKKKGVIPVNRNVYGYYVVKDKNGTMCLPRAWTEDYLGNGKYGKLRKGGVGVSSPFYIK